MNSFKWWKWWLFAACGFPAWIAIVWLASDLSGTGGYVLGVLTVIAIHLGDRFFQAWAGLRQS